ncbi:MAG: endonuclease/exonuclease/phosphatase family protein [Labilithrix sp.]|nr:endonuclease/exonuclease/phosphatase family protein [Labilithrix sp.]
MTAEAQGPAPTAPAEPTWRRRARKLAYAVVLLQLVAVASFLVMVLLGERSRLTLIALYLPRHPLLAGAALCALLAPFTRRRLLVPLQLGVCLVVLFPVMGLQVSIPSRADGERIRLASYNVFFGRLGRAELADEIVAMNADIVLVQAANGSFGELLRARLPEHTIHQEDELVLVTRYPLRSVEVPPKLDEDTPVMFMKYVVETPAGALRLYNVHPHSPRHALFSGEETQANIANREAQIQAAFTAARSDVPPFILAGDTNLPVLSSIARRHVGGVTDAFAEAGLGFGYTFPAKRPWMRIDRAFGSDGVRFVDARVGPRGASDHLPLFVEFVLDPAR